MTTNGTGSSSSSPEALNIARAASANAMPTSAQTIQDGKYEPRILREGAPSQPPNTPSIGAAHHNRAARGKRWSAPPRSGEPIAIFMSRKCHRFVRRQQSPLWGAAWDVEWLASADCRKMPECGAVMIGRRRHRSRERPRLDGESRGRGARTDQIRHTSPNLPRAGAL